METVDDVFDRYYGGATWMVNYKIYQDLCKDGIVAGDLLYIVTKDSRISNKKLNVYLSNVGASLTDNIYEATKIVNNNIVNIFMRFRSTTKPVEVPFEIANRRKYLTPHTLYGLVHGHAIKSSTVLGVSEDAFITMWEMIKNADKVPQNGILAAHAIIKTDWTGSEYLLHAMTIYFYATIRGLRLSNVHGWSAFAKAWKIIWPAREITAQQFMLILGQFYNEQQIQLINKLISK